jgi:hypothetical protein
MKSSSTPAVGGSLSVAIPQSKNTRFFQANDGFVLSTRPSVSRILWILGLLMASELLFVSGLQAQCNLLNEPFNTNPVLSPTDVDGAWYPDRYRPAGFVSDVVSGQNALKISIDGIADGAMNRPSGQQGSFYNTQGRKLNQCGKCVTLARGAIYIPADWATKRRRTDLWATTFTIANAALDYPIIGFANVDGVSPTLRYWDGSGAGVWVNVAGLVYDMWITLETSLAGGNIVYKVNGATVGSVPSVNSVYYGNIIVQAYNFNDPALPIANQSTDSYDAYWDNLYTSGSIGGNVVKNTTTNEYFCSLQDAINDAQTLAGHTLLLEGNLTEGIISLNKALTIDGNSKILTSTSATYGIEVSVAGATIKNITVDRSVFHGGTYGILSTCGSDNLIIQNTTVKNGGASGFAINGSDNVTLTNITATSNVGNGVTISNCDNLTINGITTSGNAFSPAFSAGIGLLTSSVYCLPAGINGFTLTGTISIAEPVKVYSQKANAADVITGLSGTSIAWAVGTSALDRSYWPDKPTAYAVVDALFEAPYNLPNTTVFVAEVATENFYVDDDPNGDATPAMSIQAAVNFEAPGKTVFVEEGIYNERLSVTKSLTVDGAGTLNTILEGTGLPAGLSGVTLTGGVSNITIRDLSVLNYTGTDPMSTAGIYGTSNSNLTLQNLDIGNNINCSGVYLAGGAAISDVLIDNVSAHGHTGGARGIVIWDGVKTNITIQNCEVYNNNCCGIELQDGTATGVTLQNNNVHDNADSGMSPIGMTGPGANLITNNTVKNNGRFGIEVKLPNGSGLTSGAGSIVVQNNTVTRTSPISPEFRDIAGIAVYRRGFVPSYNNVNIPTGVVVQNNTVTGYNQPSTSDGFGIVIEGTNHTVTGNIVSSNNVGIQQQAGHLPYIENTGTDGDQSNLADLYFGRGNAPFTCGNTISGNTFSGNTTNSRNVGAAVNTLAGLVKNTSTNETFCSIQVAHDDSNTANGHTITAAPGTYVENVSITKSLTINGPKAGLDADTRFAAFSGGPANPKADPTVEAIITTAVNNPTAGNPNANDLLRVLASGVTINGFVIDGNNPAIAGISGTLINGVEIDARRALTNLSSADVVVPINNLSLRYNILQNFGQRAVSISSTNALTGNQITENVIRNFKDQGVLLLNNAYADVTNNTIEVPGNAIGLHLQNFSQNSSMSWTNNNVTVGAGGIGLHANLFYAPTATLTINNNTVNAAAGVVALDDTWGVNVWSVQVGSTVAVTNNAVGSAGGDFSRGVNLWNLPTTNTVTVSGGSISRSQFGVYASNRDANFGDATTTTATISGVSINGVSEAGVYINDDPANATNADITLNINNDCNIVGTAQTLSGIVVKNSDATALVDNNDNSIHGFAIGIDVDGGSATVTNNHIYDNGIGVRFTNGGAGTVNNLNDFDGDVDPDNGRDIQATASAGVVLASPNNSFAGDIFGVENLSATNINATLNYWESPTGPGPVGYGTGTPITTKVLYCPWLNALPPGGVATGPVFNTTSLETFCSIQDAVNDAETLNGHTLEVSSNIYNEQVLVNKSVIIKGVGATKPIVNFTGTPSLVSGRLTLFEVTVPNVTIDNLKFQVDQSKVNSAVLASAADVSGLTVKNSDIIPYRSAAAFADANYSRRNAISINYGVFRVGGSTPSNLLIQNNTVTYVIGGNPSIGGYTDAGFRGAVVTDDGGGTFTGNTFQTINQDIEARFGSAGAISVTNNNLNGGGVALVEYNAGAGAITVTGNTFNGAFANFSAPNTAVLRLKNNNQAKTTTVSGNIFTGHIWGVSLENYQAVTIDNNTFTPLANNTTFRHITVNTKEISSSSGFYAPIVGLTLTNNTFNSSGVVGGSGLVFYNHDNDSPTFGTFNIGTPGNTNSFANNIATFVKLDNTTGATSPAPPAFPEYGGTIASTTMACWVPDVNIQNNLFDVGSGPQLPSAMNFAQRTVLETNLFHHPDALCAGNLIYFNPVHNLTQNTYYQTIQSAINAANVNDVIECEEYTFLEKVNITKTLTLKGVSEANTIINGTGLGNGSGITIANGVTGVNIEKFTIKNHAGTDPNAFAGIRAPGGNNGLNVQHCTIKDNLGGSGVFATGPINGLTLNDLDVSGHTNVAGPARGIVVWDGFKQNITITNCDVYNNNCCGIELQDGTASGVTMTGNNVHDNADNGFGLTGLKGGTGANLISGNMVTNNGRFGIEIKNPNGTGLTSGTGSVVVENNTVSLAASVGMNNRDHAGISVFRRAFLVNNTENYPNIPTGAVVRNNTVTGYQQLNPGSTDKGYGIVIEGTNHKVTGNTVNNSDIGIQEQGGGHPMANYMADNAGDGGTDNGQSANYFGRGNSPVACGNTISGSIFSGNTTDQNTVLGGGSYGLVTNTTTGETFCSIQAAINDAQTLDGHTLTVGAGEYPESVNVTKSLTINGAGNGNNPATSTVLTPSSACSGVGITISAANVTVQNMYITNYQDAVLLNGVNNPTLNNLVLEDYCRYGVTVGGNNQSITITQTMIKRTALLAGTIGIRVGTANAVNGLLIDGCSITGNALQGIVVFQATTPVAFDNIMIKNSTISNNTQKGMYFEKLSNATLENLTMDNNGTDAAYGFNNGIDINLKYGNYSNITIQNCDITNSGVNGTATDPQNASVIAVKARNDGSYSAIPATLTGVTIKNNLITGPKNGIRFGEIGVINNGPSNVTVEGNDLSYAFGNKAIVRRTNNDVNMVCNWHGTTVLPTILATFAEAGTGNIILSSALGAGGDASVAVGFQPAGSCTCPSGNLVTNTNTMETFCTIQAAIDDAQTLTGHTLSVSAGTYIEDVIVNKSLIINGPNAAVNPCTGTRVAEAIVVPATAAIATGEIIHVAASNVTISGFTINGDNTALTSGFTSTNGADIDAAEGVTVYETLINNLTVTNNIIKNLSYFGVTLYDYPAGVPSSGHLISNNKFQDLGTYDATSLVDYWGGAVLLYNNQYAAVTNNCMDNVRLGVQTGNFSQANPGSATYQVIDGNIMTNVRRTGVFHNLHYGTASAYTVSNNTITGASNANETKWDGVSMFSLSVPSTASGNIINGSSVTQASTGIEVWQVQNTSPTAISGGSVTGVNTGLFLNNFEGYVEDASFGAHATVSGLGITPKVGGIGIRVLDSPSSTLHAAAALNIGAGVTVTGGANSVSIEGGNAWITALNNLALVTPTGNYIQLLNTAMNDQTLDATAVSFDAVLGNAATNAQNFAIEDKVFHEIDNNTVGLVMAKTNQVFVTDIATPAPTNNDYTRIKNGVEAVSNNWTINLKGTFDWTEANATAAWVLGNDGVSGNADDYSILPPANLNGVTFTAPDGLGTATIQGPGDVATINLEGVFYFDGSSDNQGWTISNMDFLDFDLAIGFFNGLGGTDAFNNTTITNNHIRLATDLSTTAAPADPNQNIGIHYSFGANQTISNNIIDIPGNAVNDAGLTVASVGMQSNTSGGAVFNGLSITGNTINVQNAQSAAPESIRGIWENGHAHSSNVTVSNNQFLNLAGGNNPVLNRQIGFRITSHSSPTTTSTYSGNTVKGANTGFQWITGSNFAAEMPVVVTSNILKGNEIAMLIQSNGKALLTTNDFDDATDNTIDVQIQAGSIMTSGGGNQFAGDNYYVENLSATAINITTDLFDQMNDYRVADRIYDALDNVASGLVRFDGTNLYVSNPGTGIADETIPNAVGAAAATGDIINIEMGSYASGADATSKEVTFAPGSSPGCVTLAGDMVLTAGDALAIEINGTTPCTQYDQFIVNGMVTLGGANLAITLGMFTPTSGNQFTIIDGTSPVTGQFVQGSSITVGGTVFSIDYAAGDGFDVVLTACGAGTVHNMTTGESFCNIQDAIDDAGTGNVINVDAGVYNENIIVNKPLTLNGANSGISCSAGRGAESIINGTSGSGSVAISIASDGVTIDGFTISNPLGSFGIYAQGRNNTTVQYNIITNIGNSTNGSGPTYGVAIEMGSTANISNVNIANNCVNNIRGGQNTSLTGAAAKANNGSGVGIGAGFSNASFDISNLTISGNEITSITACISAFSDGGKGAYGVIINVGASNSFNGKAVSPLVQNNNITSLEGLWAHGVGLEGETPGATVLNNYINNLIDHKGNTDAIGVLLEDNAGAATVGIHDNSFTNLSFGIKNVETAFVNATCNWYGSAAAGVVAAKISGNVTSAPWTTNGMDNSSATGFQPVPGSCIGTPVVIVSAVSSPQTCAGLGSILVTFSGGTGPYNIAWTTGSATGISSPYTISSLAGGTYDITVTDAVASSVTASVLVQYLPVTNVTLNTHYLTIQAAVTAATATNVIEVCKGTYAETITVDKALTINGPQDNVDADTRFAAFVTGVDGPKAAPAIEAIITAPTNNPTSGNPGANDLFRVLASGVTINGFVIDGNNPAIAGVSGTVLNGVEIDARRALTNVSSADVVVPINNLNLQFNILQNFGQRGISLSGNAASTGNTITENVIRNFKDQGVLLLTNAYVNVSNNTVNVPADAIGLHLQNFSQNGSMTWSGNNVTVGAGGIGIHANLFYAPTATLTISGNTVNAASGVLSASDTWGINVWSVQEGSTVAVSANTIGSAGGDFSRGINLWNLPTTNTVTVSAGTVSRSKYGIYAANKDANFGDATTTTATLNGVSISGASTAGVYVYDDPANANNSDITLNVQGATTISNSVTGVLVEGADATLTSSGAYPAATISGNTAHGIRATVGTVDADLLNINTNGVGIEAQNGATVAVNTSNITSNTGNGATNSNVGGTPVLDATNNWWGNADGPDGAGPGTGDEVSANVNFCPWLGAAAPGGAPVTPTLTIGVTENSGFPPANNGAICLGASVVLNATTAGASSYAWSPNSQTTASITESPISMTTYSVTVTVPGCILTDDQLITVTPLPVAVISGNPSICFGSTTMLTASGGDTYLWEDNSTNPIRVVSTAGTYSVTVSSTFGCTDVESINVIAPAAIVITGTTTDVSCFDGSDGAIALDPVTGGTPGYSYMVMGPGGIMIPYNPNGYVLGELDGQNGWDGGAGQPLFGGDDPGDDAVSIADHHSGTQSWEYRRGLNSPGAATPFTPVVASVGAPGNGAVGDRSIIKFAFKAVTPSDGSFISVYEGSVNRDDRTGANIYLDAIPGGMVELSMYKAIAGPDYYDLVVIGQYPAGSWHEVEISTTYPATNNLDHTTWGTSTYKVDGLTVLTETPWTHWWRFKNNFAYAPGSSLKFANGSSNAQNGFYIDDLSFEVKNGATTVGYFGTGFESGNNLDNLVAGTYTVKVTDANSCTNTQTFVVNQPLAPVSASATQVNVLCFGSSTGSINLTPVGGTPGYTYLWSNGAVTEDVSGLAAGTYTVTVTDSKGCVATASATITQPVSGLAATSLQNTVICNGGSTGNINLSVTGGTGVYTFEWSNGPTTEDLSGVSAGLYTVTVTDANGCTLMHNVTITQATAIVLSETNVDVACYGNSTGSIDLGVSGGGVNTTAPVGMDGVIGAEWAGASVKVVNYNPAAPTGNFGTPTGENHVVAYNVYTRQDANFLYVACQTNSALGGAPNASVRFANIYFGGNTSIGFETGTTPTAAFLPGMPGSFPVAGLIGTPNEVFTSTDFSGAEYVIELAVPLQFIKDDPLGVGFTKLDGSAGKSFARISLSQSFGYSVAGGLTTYGTNRLGYYSIPNNIIDGSYTYNWSNGATTQDISGLPAGTYLVTVTDDLGCAANTSVLISQPAGPLVVAPTSNSPICYNQTLNLFSNASGGTSSYTYSWAGPNGFSAIIADPSIPNATPLASGTYTVTVTDANACVTIATTSVVTVGAAPTITCPAPITTTTSVGGTGDCLAALNLTHPTPVSDCLPVGLIIGFSNGTPVPGSLPAGGTVTGGGINSYSFAKGQTVVTYTATDNAGNVTSCAVTVTVTDNEAPTITCPAPVTVGILDPRDPYATGTATGTDNCGTVTITYNDNRAGLTGCNATGTIVRTFTATDASNNSLTCSVVITVQDLTAPVLSNCPTNITVNAAANSCAATVNYTDPTAIDQGYFQGFETASYVSGGYLNNPSTDWNDSNSPLTRVASGTDGITSKTGASHAVITSTPAPPANITGAFNRLGGYSTVFGTGFRSSQDVYIDLTNPAVAANTYGWDLSTAVNDQMGNHRRDFIFHATTNGSGAVLIGGNNNTNGAPATGLVNPYTVPSSGWYTCQWLFFNNNGPLAVQMNLLNASGTIVWNTTLSDPSDLIATVVGGNRYMWFTFLAVNKLAIDNSELTRNANVVCAAASGTSFPVGTSTVTCTATDACMNNTSCTFSVTVVDNQPPAIVCPTNITVNSTPPNCSAVVTYTAPIGTDNCGSPVTTKTDMTGLSSGSTFPVGTTVLQYTVTDAAMLTSACTFAVIVNDTEMPTITCPANASVGILDPRDPYATLWATGTDNCMPVPTITYDDDRSGLAACNATGTILRTFTAKDASGNTRTCTQTITVTDLVLPVLSNCPANITTNVDPTLCTAVVNYTDPTALDLGYRQDFENTAFVSGTYPNAPSTDWNNYNSVLTRQPSGYNSIPSNLSSGIAVINSTVLPASPDDDAGAFNRLGGYSSVFGTGFHAYQDVYIDLSHPAVAANTYGWDLSTAVNNNSGAHLRDFIFHAATSGGAVVISGDNNSNNTPQIAGGSTYTVPSSGWYTFEWNFRNNAGVLAVDLILRNAGGTQVWTKTLSNPGDAIAGVGGNRYMWFTFLAVDQLAIDNSRLERNASVVCAAASGTIFPLGTSTVTCTATDACLNTSSCTFTVTVNPTVVPLVSITASANPICAGANATFTATPTFGGASPTYQWYVGATPVGTGPMYSSTSLVNGDQVSVVMTSNYPCPVSPIANSNVITMMVNPLPVGNNAVGTSCSNSAVGYDLQANVNTLPGNSVNSNFSWFALSDNPQVTGETLTPLPGDILSNTLVNLTNTPQSVVYRVTPTSDPEGCVGAFFDVTITVNPTPDVATIPVSIPAQCSGATTDITVTNPNLVAGTTYNWSAPITAGITELTSAVGATGVLLSTHIQQTLTNTTNAPITVTFTITPVGPAPSNCTGTPITRTVVVNPTPAGAITASNAAVCSGNPVMLTFTATAGTGNYDIVVNGTTYTNVVSGVSFATVSPAMTTTYTLTNILDLGVTPNCANASPASAVTVTVTASPTAAISGTTTICNGQSATLTLAVTGSGTISGLLSEGTAFSGVAPTITVNVSPTINTTYTIASMSDVNCPALPGGLTGSAIVTVNNRPTAVLSGGGTICNGQSVTLSLAVTGSGTISGTLSDGTAFSGTAPTITVNVTPSLTTIYTIATLSDANCAAIAGDLSGSATVNVNARPTALISGTTTVCNGTSATLTLTVTGSGTISGTLSNGAVFSGTAPTITVVVSPSMNTTYTVATLSDANCSAIAADLTGSAVVTVNARPTAVLSGTASICNGQTTTLTLTVTGSGTISGTLSSGTAFSGTAPTITVNVSPTMTTTYTIATLVDANCTAIAGDISGSAIITVTNCSDISGKLIWEGDRLTTMTGVNSATVNLTGDATGSNVTGLPGTYLLSATMGSTFTVTPVKNKPMPDAINGLSAADASRIQQHVTGAFPLTDSYKLIAADVNQTNSITAQDVSLITQAVLGNPIAQAVFINKTWRFVPKAYVFPMPLVPWGFPEKITLSGGAINQDFIGMKLGDVNNTADPVNAPGSVAPNLIWNVQDQILVQDASFVVEFRAENYNELMALQFALSFDVSKIQFQEIEAVPGSPIQAANFGMFNLASGHIRAMLAMTEGLSLPNGTPVFRLRFKALKDGIKLSDVLQLNNNLLQGEAYLSDFTPGPVNLVYESISTTTVDPGAAYRLTLLQNRPNPFTDATAIGFILPEECEAQMRVFDVSGRLISEQKGWYPKGYNEMKFLLNGFAGEGVLLYELTTPFGTLSKKMVLIRE